jgi:hypothetical protein
MLKDPVATRPCPTTRRTANWGRAIIGNTIGINKLVYLYNKNLFNIINSVAFDTANDTAKFNNIQNCFIGIKQSLTLMFIICIIISIYWRGLKVIKSHTVIPVYNNHLPNSFLSLCSTYSWGWLKVTWQCSRIKGSLLGTESSCYVLPKVPY